MAIVKDLTGHKYGRLTAVEYVGKTKNGNAKWLCKCDCGGRKVVASWGLISGRTQSCGCIKREQNHQLFFQHGESGSNRTRLYGIWSGMKNRCYNEKQSESFQKYGAHGIEMCDEWKNSYETFRDWALSNGYDDGLTIDRINFNGPYCPQNYRWATQKEQQNNRSNNHYIEFRGETKTMAEWSELAGFGRSVIEHRLSRGWTIENALLSPRQETHNGKRVYIESKLCSYRGSI